VNENLKIKNKEMWKIRQACRFTGLSLWTGWGWKGGYLPHNLPLASEVGFPGVVVRKQGLVDCVCCVGVACCIYSISLDWECPFLLLHDNSDVSRREG
jgi:hypothetical protein